jgi:hypothetical protein
MAYMSAAWQELIGVCAKLLHFDIAQKKSM